MDYRLKWKINTIKEIQIKTIRLLQHTFQNVYIYIYIFFFFKVRTSHTCRNADKLNHSYVADGDVILYSHSGR